MSSTEELARLIEERSGIVVPERELARLRDLAERCAREAGVRSIGEYLEMLRRSLDSNEWRTLLTRITINESYLFRAPQQLDALAKVVIPEIAAKRRDRSLRVWSAGCARGEEAVTLAIVLAEHGFTRGRDWRILATDVDEEALRDARRARYRRRATSRVPSSLLRRYFTERGDELEVCAELMQRIDYRLCNLIQRPLGLPESSYDIVFLRNVLIYFNANRQREVVDAVAAVMAPDGFLFLGPTESLWRLYPEMTAVDLGECFCYRRMPHDGALHPDRSVADVAASHRKASTKKRASKRRASSSSRRAGGGEGPQVSVATAHYEPIIELLCAGDLKGALEGVQRGTRRFPESAVLRALEGLIHDLQGEHEDALRAYRAALYLDPTLFQVRFFLARNMQRLGWHERARGELTAVLSAVGGSATARTLPGTQRLGLPSQSQVQEACKAALGSSTSGGEPEPAP